MDKEANKLKKKRFIFLLSKRIPVLIELIMKEYKLSEDDAIKKFYQSELYHYLSLKYTKIWWFSIPALFEIYKTEIKTGSIKNSTYLVGEA